MNTHRVSTWSGRPHDYLYDPCCILSSAKDHAKEANRAANYSCDLAFVPFYRRMFSEMQNYPSGVVQMQDRRPIPWFISRKYRTIGSGLHKTEVFPPYSDQITGPELCNFFKRPRTVHASHDELVAMLYHLDYSVISSQSCEQLSDCIDSPKLFAEQSTQTDFRESEAQTDPYSPDYKIPENFEPELLTLASIAWGKGLQVGENEIIMIERARIKKHLEASLPPLTAETYRERIRMISEIEWSEWKFRDEQIQEIHNIKMILINRLLADEHEQFVTGASKRMMRVWKRRRIDRDKLEKKLNKYKFRENHKLLERQRKIIEKLSEYNKVDLHFDPGSELFTPLLRNGNCPIKCREKPHSLTCNYLNSYKDVLAFEKYVTKKHLTTNYIPPVLQKIPETGYVKRKYKNSKQLDDAYKTMLSERGLTAVQKTFTGTMALMEKLEKPPPRPMTPEIRGPGERTKQIEQNIIVLQKILRGRAVQILMHDGKERCADLIEELRTFHALYSDLQLKLDNMRVLLKRKTDEKVKIHRKEQDLETIVESLVGDKVAQMLDFLSKELVRLQDERRIHALSILAERQRRLREAEESGLRQMEERRRREEQEIFRNILNVHQKSIDLYLDEIINSSIYRTISSQAAYEMEAMARRIDETANELEEKSNEIQSQEMIADLLHSFILPEVERMKMRENVRRRQYASLNAVHEFLYSDMKSGPSCSPSIQTTPPPPPPSAGPSAAPSAAPSLQPSAPPSAPVSAPTSRLKLKRSSKESDVVEGKVSRLKRLSVVSKEDWHALESLEEWDIYLPGQIKYNQLRNLITYDERHLEFNAEIAPVTGHRRQSIRTRSELSAAISKRKSKLV